MAIRTAVVVLLATLTSCAAGEARNVGREVEVVDVTFSQAIAVRSSVLQFVFPNTAQRQATHGAVEISGSLGDGVQLNEAFDLPVGRAESGDLLVELRVVDTLWDRVEPDPNRTLSGRVDFALEDEIGVFAIASLDDFVVRFRRDFPPTANALQSGLDVFAEQLLSVQGAQFLRPEEGRTIAIVDGGRIVYDDGSTRAVNNESVALKWVSRETALLPISPTIFGVRPGRFEGDLRFRNVLSTGETFDGNTIDDFRAQLQLTRIDEISPRAGSRSQKITIEGRGFVGPANDTSAGTYFMLTGTFAPADGSPVVTLTQGSLVMSPYRVVSEQRVEQDVSYGVDAPTRSLTGLGARPGVFTGEITPFIYRGNAEQAGIPWRGSFEVLPTRQAVHVKYLPGFSRTLQQFGLADYEADVRARIMEVLRRDYADVNVVFSEDEPTDFVEFTTIEIGGPDPSGLLNFGYDNSFNEGGKDIENLYLGDYLGGVNRHSQDAGYLPYGGVFVESFIAFSPTLSPNGFGTADEFDVVMAPFMPELGGQAATGDVDGPRALQLDAAIHMIANLTGHTASHELGHAFGLAYFPSTMENFDQRFHNEPAGPRWIMDAGVDRPFDERAEINGAGPAKFNEANLRYLKRILPKTP